MTRSDPAKFAVALMVPNCDAGGVGALDLPVTPLSAEIGPEGLRLTEDGVPVVARAQAARMTACLVLTAAGEAEAGALLSGWRAATGRDLPLLDLSAVAIPAQEMAALRGVTRLCGERLGALAGHNADLLGMLAALRMAHEEQEVALRRTRDFLLKTVESTRWLAQSHGPLSRTGADQFALAPAARLCQRLSASSAGVSDLGIFLPDQDWPDKGILRIRAHLIESGAEAAAWNLSAADLGPGWLRLTFLDALEDDEQTLTLDVVWEGAAPLLLGAGLHHPDPAFGADLAGRRQDRILAHRVWKYMPGARAPLPADGHWTASPGDTPVYVDPDHLAAAQPVDPNNPCLQYFQKFEALQVHPRPQGPSAARLTGAVAPGLREISAIVGGRDERVPAVDYALAVVPHHPLREIGDLLADSARSGHLSDWVCLSGDQLGDLRLILPAPVTQRSDLILVTRPAQGANHAYGWATFRGIRMSAGTA